MKISFCFEAVEFQCDCIMRPLKVRKLVCAKHVSSQKYENGYQTKICNFTVCLPVEAVFDTTTVLSHLNGVLVTISVSHHFSCLKKWTTLPHCKLMNGIIRKHITVNYNYHTIMCAIFRSKSILEVMFWGFSPECQATRFLQRIFLLLCVFTSGMFQTLFLHCIKCLTTIKRTKKWLTSPIEAFRVKNHRKNRQKFLQREFFVSSGESFWPGQRRYVQRIIMPEKFQSCAIFVHVFFFQEKVTQRWWTDIILPFLSLAALLRITCWCNGFMACMGTRFDGNSVARSTKVGHLSQALASCTVRMFIGRKPVCLTSSSCDVISPDLFLFDSDLFSVERINENFSFFQSQIKLQPYFLPRVKNESIQRTGSYENIWSKFYFW